MEIYEQVLTNELNGMYARLRAEIYWNHDDVALRVWANPDVIDVASDNPTTEIQIDFDCDNAPEDGAMINLSTTGPGYLDVSSVVSGSSSHGTSKATLTATDSGQIVVTASFTACRNNSEQDIEASANIDAVKDEGWAGYGYYVFDHSPGTWTFHDSIYFGYIFNVGEDGQITGEGTGYHHVTVSPTDCALLSINAPEFPMYVSGTTFGDNFVFQILPVSPATYPVDFTMQCDDAVMTIDAYRYLEASVLGMHVIFNMPPQTNSEDEGSGSEDFGESYPIMFEYYLMMNEL
nr:hypothetical protein [candidate division Zixibacteria bacterium]